MAKPSAIKENTSSAGSVPKKKRTVKRTPLRKGMGCSVYLAVFFFLTASFFIGITLVREYLPTVVVGYLTPSLHRIFPGCIVDVSVKSAKLFRANVSCSVYSEDSNGGMKGDLNSITIDYTPWSLMKGRISSVVFENVNIVMSDNSHVNAKTFDEQVSRLLSNLAEPLIDVEHVKLDGIFVLNEGGHGIMPIRNTMELFSVRRNGERSYRISYAASSLGRSSVKFNGEYSPANNVLDGNCSFALASDTAAPCLEKYLPSVSDVPFSLSGSGKIIFSTSERKLKKDTCINGTLTPGKNAVSSGMFPVSTLSFKFGSDDGNSVFWEIRHLKTSVCGFEPEIASLTLKQTGSSAKGSAVVVIGPGMQFDADVAVNGDENGALNVSVKSLSGTSGQVDNGTVRISGGKADVSADLSFPKDGSVSGSFFFMAPDVKYECSNQSFSGRSVRVSGQYCNGVLATDVSAFGVSSKTKNCDFKAGKLFISARISSKGECTGNLSFDDGCIDLKTPDGKFVFDGVSVKHSFAWNSADGFDKNASKGSYVANAVTFRDKRFATSSGELLLDGKKLTLSGNGTVCGRKYNSSAEFSPDGDKYVEITVPRQKLELSGNGLNSAIPLRGLDDLVFTKGEVKGHVRLTFADGRIDPVMLIVLSDLDFSVPGSDIYASGGNVVLTDAGRSISFSTVHCGKLEFGRTNVTVSYDDDDVVTVENANASFCGGTVKLMPGKFDRRSGKLRAELVCSDLNSRDLAKMFVPSADFYGNLALSGTVSASLDDHGLSILPGSRLSSVNDKYVETKLSSGGEKGFVITSGHSRGTASFGVEIPEAMAQNALKHFNYSWCSATLSGNTAKGISASIVSCGRPIDFTGYAFVPEDMAFAASKKISPDDEMVINSGAVIDSDDLEKFISWLSSRFLTNM